MSPFREAGFRQTIFITHSTGCLNTPTRVYFASTTSIWRRSIALFNMAFHVNPHTWVVIAVFAKYSSLGSTLSRLAFKEVTDVPFSATSKIDEIDAFAGRFSTLTTIPYSLPVKILFKTNIREQILWINEHKKHCIDTNSSILERGKLPTVYWIIFHRVEDSVCWHLGQYRWNVKWTRRCDIKLYGIVPNIFQSPHPCHWKLNSNKRTPSDSLTHCLNHTFVKIYSKNL